MHYGIVRLSPFPIALTSAIFVVFDRAIATAMQNQHSPLGYRRSRLLGMSPRSQPI